jgi:Flp pilus assembly protein TadD
MRRTTKILSLLAMASFVALSWPLPADAAKRPFAKPQAAATVKKCKKGEIWHKKKQACIKAETGLIPDADLLDQAQILADNGHYEWAIQILAVTSRSDDPEVQGLLGYSHRKAGRIDTGISYYLKALASDPGNLRIREYLGEGYVTAGKLALAKAELGELALRCGADCPEYRTLQAAIAHATEKNQ